MNQQEIANACQQFRLGNLQRRALGSHGDQAGVGIGSSIEFFDFRNYIPGDDLRHVDWNVYARTGDLTVRRYREEVQPRLDLLVDGSRSMAIDDGRKADLARELAEFLFRDSRRRGITPTLHLLAEQCQQPHSAAEIPFSAAGSCLFAGGPLPRLAPRGLRVLISDFMSDQPPLDIVRRLSDNGAGLLVIRLLGPWEASPNPGDTWRLVDAESGKQLAVTVTPQLRRRYLQQLATIAETLRDLCQRCGAAFVDLRADASLTSVLIRDFLPMDLVLPR